MKWRVEFRVLSSVQLEYCFSPPESFSDEQLSECVGENRITKREKNRIRDGQKRDPIFICFLKEREEVEIIVLKVDAGWLEIFGGIYREKNVLKLGEPIVRSHDWLLFFTSRRGGLWLVKIKC